jgi:hypothetical protein
MEQELRDQHERQMSVFDRIVKALLAINNSVIESTKQQALTNAKLDILIVGQQETNARLDTLIALQQSNDVASLSVSVDTPQ